MYYAEKWGLNSSQWKEKIDASVIGYLIYVFDLFYLHTQKIDLDSLLSYSWQSFVPDEITMKTIDDNSILSELQKNLFHWIIDKDKKNIKKYYRKKSAYQQVKKIKRKIIHKKTRD